MQRAMDRLEGFVRRRGRPIVAAWVVVLVATIPFMLRQTEHLTSGGFESPGSDALYVERALDRFDAAQKEALAVVVARRPEGDAASVRRGIDRVERATRGIDHVSFPREAVRVAKREAGDAAVTVAPLRLMGDADQNADAVTDLRDELAVGEPRDGVQLHLAGQQALWAGMQDLSKEDLESAERTGFPIVLLILLAVFGSLAAAALPLALGFASVAVTGASIYFLSQATDMSVFVTNVASMIGIGVAVDYSLFVLARYREEVRAGRDPQGARRIAMRTSGLAVAFSGVTVIISLAGLFLVNSPVIRSMAMGAIIVVAVSILGAVTLLPALMSMLGRRVYIRGRLATAGGLLFRGWRWMRRRPGSTRPGRVRTDGFWQRWTGAVTRRPALAALASAAVLLTLAIPALSLEWGNGALRQFPEEYETRVGARLAAERTGAGAAGPFLVVAELDRGKAGDPSNRRAIDRYAAALGRDREVARVERGGVSRDERSVLLLLTSRHDHESEEASALLDRLRTRADSGRDLAGRASIHVGGATAYSDDWVDLVSGSLWKILLFVMAFSYLVLMVLLRSVVLPLKAVLMNLLSVAAAYGVLVAVFQYGWIDGLFGFESLGYIQAMTPPFLLAITFGLSMDYEVFLLTRIRERYDQTRDTRTAVAQGLAASAKTISSAALIMVAVFAVFAGVGVPSVKEIGLGLSVAIALDATLVRLVLVPAAMELMGRWNWWLPRPLARILPRTDWEAPDRAQRGAAEGAAAGA
jgi:uncharacterized membrane protein YdfJ with MMPL/SSD domain